MIVSHDPLQIVARKVLAADDASADPRSLDGRGVAEEVRTRTFTSLTLVRFAIVSCSLPFMCLSRNRGNSGMYLQRVRVSLEVVASNDRYWPLAARRFTQYPAI